MPLPQNQGKPNGAAIHCPTIWSKTPDMLKRINNLNMLNVIKRNTHSLTHSLTHSFTHSLTHSPTHPSTHSPTHSLTHSLTHSKDYDKSCLTIVLKWKLHFWKSLIQAFRIFDKFAKKSKPFE